MNWTAAPFAYLDSAFSRHPVAASSFSEILKLSPSSNFDSLEGDALKRRKATSVAFFPHAFFGTGRKASDAQQPTGLVQLDFDHVNDVEALKVSLKAIPWIAFATTSISGRGVWAMAYTGKEHSISLANQVLDAVEAKTGQDADRKNSISVAALRFLSADNSRYICEAPVAFS